VTRDEIVIEGSGRAFDATRFQPAGGAGDSAWILLHGITRPGRRHPVLLRFAETLAGSGATVLIPEIPEWTALRLDPRPARAVTLAAAEALAREADRPKRPGLIGFSFGAPQAIRLASEPEVAGRLACVAAFGGYDTLRKALAFLWSGCHTWEGTSYRLRPDPYGRWVVGANFLTGVPGMEDAGDVAEALRELAAVAGDRQIPSWDPLLDEWKDRVERRLAPTRRSLFRQFAPPAQAEPLGVQDEEDPWADRLSRAGLVAQPLLALPPVVQARVPVVLVHGRHDPLIPFSETLRLERRIRAPTLHVSVTDLFEHSQEAGRGGPGRLRELWRFGRTLSSLLGLA
jgi:dienelactone hydrolase